MLEAAYEATLLAGRINEQRGGTPIVYLTRIGGGVFRNPLSWIDDAIRLAHERVPGGKLLIVSYGAPDAALQRLVS